MHGDNKPYGAEEVAENEDEKDQADHSEDVHDVDLLHYLVFVFAHRMHIRVILDSSVNATVVNFLEESLEFRLI